jgi:succinate-semialdehyde dehydrogenase/glutarate-semialdehyde dehydrogenase
MMMTADGTTTTGPRPSGDAERADSSPDEVGRAVQTAYDARHRWRRTAPSDRAACLREAAASVRGRSDDLGDALCATTGRLLREARQSARVAADLLDEAAVTGLGIAGRTLAGSTGAVDLVRAEPRGVVAVLTPWNDPFPAAAGLLAAALVTGNTVVHKPSERSAAPGALMAALVAACLPPGVLQVLRGGGDVGAQVAADGRVAMVAHVGSSATGRTISAVTGARGARALLENGGKDPIVVDAGVDPAWAARQIATGAFTNAGQLCTAVERVYLHANVAEAVTAELVRLAEGLQPGDPREDTTTLTPMVDERQLRVVDDHVSAAVAQGAVCLTGGRRLEREGSWYPATVLTGCTADMAVMTQETFGPVAPVTVVGGFDEGLRLAAESDYGLAATVLTPDSAHAMRAVEDLDVGTVKVNAVFGGAPGGSADPRRASGSGCGYGPDLLREFVVLKAVHLGTVPGA